MLVPKKTSYTFVAVSSIFASLFTFGFLLHKTHPQFHPTPVGHRSENPLRDDFIADYTEYHVGSAPDSSSIGYLCNRTTHWQPNVVLHLTQAGGGIGNVRGSILDFVFFAIQAGASIMLPAIDRRAEEDINNLWSGHVAFDTFFDQDHFIQSLQLNCPQMQVYLEPEEKLIEQFGPAVEEVFRWVSMRSDIKPEDTVEAAVKKLHDHIGDKADGGKSLLVHVERTLWQSYDTRSLPAVIRRDFAGILHLNAQVHRLAAIVTYNMVQRFGFAIEDPTRSYFPGTFFGAHLRTEADAVAAGWIDDSPHRSYEAQTDAYLAQAASRDLNVLYVASGSLEHLHLFAEKARKVRKGTIITHKSELLDHEDLRELQSLSWDQQALVDYLVLERCAYFGGFIKSSFSYNLAMTRNVILEDDQLSLDVWDVSSEDVDDTVAFNDGLSKVWGRDPENHEISMPRGMWP